MMAVRSLSVARALWTFIISNRGTETPDPFENTAILALVRNAFIWLSEYSFLMIDFSLSELNASARYFQKGLAFQSLG
jgi:hypothetical protein